MAQRSGSRATASGSAQARSESPKRDAETETGAVSPRPEAGPVERSEELRPSIGRRRDAAGARTAHARRPVRSSSPACGRVSTRRFRISTITRASIRFCDVFAPHSPALIAVLPDAIGSPYRGLVRQRLRLTALAGLRSDAGARRFARNGAISPWSAATMGGATPTRDQASSRRRDAGSEPCESDRISESRSSVSDLMVSLWYSELVTQRLDATKGLAQPNRLLPGLAVSTPASNSGGMTLPGSLRTESSAAPKRSPAPVWP